MATAPGAASSTSRSTAGSPGRMAAGSCAPHRAAARNGPSRCRPASRPSATSGASAATAPGEHRRRRGDQARELGRRAVGAVVGHRRPAHRPRPPPGNRGRPRRGSGRPRAREAAAGRTEAAASPPPSSRPSGRPSRCGRPVTATIPSSIRRPPAITVPRRTRSDMGFTPPDTGAQAALGDGGSGLGGLGVVLQLAAGGAQVPAPDDEPEQRRSRRRRSPGRSR